MVGILSKVYCCLISNYLPPIDILNDTWNELLLMLCRNVKLHCRIQTRLNCSQSSEAILQRGANTLIVKTMVNLNKRTKQSNIANKWWSFVFFCVCPFQKMMSVICQLVYSTPSLVISYILNVTAERATSNVVQKRQVTLLNKKHI